MAKWDHEDLKDVKYKKKEDGGNWEDPKPYPKSVVTVKKTRYKYSEDLTVDELDKYLKSTYGAHYAEDDNIQCFDAWEALDKDPSPTHRNMALKYLWRYGKKNGCNRDDLLKALHYVIMLMHYNTKLHKKG